MKRWVESFAAFSLLFAGLVAGPAGAMGSSDLAAQWTQDHFDAAHSGYNPHETILSPTTVGGLHVKWSAGGGFDQMMNPLVTTTTVYGAGARTGSSHSMSLRAYDRETGTLLWQVSQPGGDTVAGIATLGSRVFVSTLGDHAVRAYDATSGVALWTFTTNTSPSAPVVAHGKLFVQATTAKLYAIDPATGVALWTMSCDASDGRDPAVAGTKVFTANGYANSVQAFDGRTRKLRWTAPLDGPDIGSPTAVDGRVFVQTLTGSLYSLEQETGAVVWQSPVGGGSTTPAVANGTVFVGDGYGDLHAFRESDGEELWTASTQRGFVLSSPIVANGVVYAATQDAYAFDAATGALLWQGATNDVVNAAPALVDGVLYVADFSGRLWAFGLPSNGFE